MGTQILESMPYELIFLDRSGTLLYGNRKFLDKLGYTKNHFHKLKVFDLNTTATEDSWERHWNTVKEQGSLSFTEVHKDRKGNFYEVEVYAMFVKRAQEEYIAALLNDISKSSYTRFMLESTEEITGVGGWKLNLNDSSLTVSEQCLQIFGTWVKETFLPGKIIEQFREPEQLKTAFSSLLRKGTPYDLTLELSRRPGFFVRCIAHPIYKGKRIVKVIGSYQDVTESMRREQHLISFEQVIRNTRDIICFVSQDFTVRYANRAALELLKLSNSELVGKNLFRLIPGLDQSGYRHAWESTRDNSVQHHYSEIRIFDRDYAFSNTFLRVDYQGEHLLGIISQDITELRKQEQRLRQALGEISDMKDELENENQYLREEARSRSRFDHIVCISETYARVLDQVEQVAPTDSTVLITGESGTGKELLARAVHENSRRRDKPLIKVNCATLPKDLIESELFGHRKGAFTGSTEHKVGKFTLADQGTLFLDEIGELPLELQPKLLRALQDGEFDEVGGTRTIQVDTRIVAATNRDLDKMVRKGEFREDLFYRLNVFPIHNIPLRERREDIPLLAEFFLEKYAKKIGKDFRRLHPKTLDSLRSYGFPGNIRELENLIERAVIVSQGPVLKPGPWLPKSDGPVSDERSFVSFEEAQRQYLIKVLEHTGGKVSGPGGAAEILEMNDKTLYARMKRLGIQRSVMVGRG